MQEELHTGALPWCLGLGENKLRVCLCRRLYFVNQVASYQLPQVPCVRPGYEYDVSDKSACEKNQNSSSMSMNHEAGICQQGWTRLLFSPPLGNDP